MFIYCRNNPIMHSDPDGNWVLDAFFLAADVASCIANPSAAAVGWVLLDVACFADPTGAGAAVAHLTKTAHAVEATSRAIQEAGRAGELLGRYSKVKAAVKDMGLEAHHLVEKRFAKTLGVKQRDMLSVALTKEQHRIYTKRWRKEIGYGFGTKTAKYKKIVNAVDKIYHDNEALRQATHNWLNR
jgi:hypothetical protein